MMSSRTVVLVLAAMAPGWLWLEANAQNAARNSDPAPRTKYAFEKFAEGVYFARATSAIASQANVAIS